MKEVLIVDTKTTVLAAKSRIFKSELFIRQTGHFLKIDKFVSKLAESVILDIDRFKVFEKNGSAGDWGTKCYRIDTDGGEHSFFFTLGGANSDSFGQLDIVFFNYSGRDGYILKGDGRLADYFKAGSFMVSVESLTLSHDLSDFKKLYHVYGSDVVNYPRLNDIQREIVETEDKNMLVQGVAGSGKTNVCIDKLIFSASRGYSGRVLYSTFSRGLLVDTQKKVLEYAKYLDDFVFELEAGNVVFIDGDKVKAIENKLGVELFGVLDENFSDKICKIAKFLRDQVDFFLIEDLYAKYISDNYTIADEVFFVQSYVKGIKNHQLTSRLDKIKHISYEVVYKEIYGVIFGCRDNAAQKEGLSVDEYYEKRKNSFSRQEIETIYAIAGDYGAFIQANGFVDNNLMSKRLLECGGLPRYSLAILDEVQDMTELNLCLIKAMSLKMFCVGDALQMINPSYFSFAYLKRLLFEKDITPVAELVSNYRSSQKIADIANELSKLNALEFGVHSFVLSGTGFYSGLPTSARYVNDSDFIELLSESGFNNYTLITSGVKEKELLRDRLPKQEILTVSEIKGLERDVVILWNVLHSNARHWRYFERIFLNRKTADENSVFRYYFNLFYVGISRARSHVYVFEESETPQFSKFFKKNFELTDADGALAGLKLTSNKDEADEVEFIARAEEFIKFGQYDNARFAIEKILDARTRVRLTVKSEVFEQFIAHGRYKDAGIRYWEHGYITEAREQFVLAREDELLELLDVTARGSSGDMLDINILKMLPDLLSNTSAKKLIFDTIEKDLNTFTKRQVEIRNALGGIRHGG